MGCMERPKSGSSVGLVKGEVGHGALAVFAASFTIGRRLIRRHYRTDAYVSGTWLDEGIATDDAV